MPGQNLPTPEQVFGESVLFDLLKKSGSEDLPPSSEDLSLSSEDMDEFGRLLSRLLSAPVVHDLAKLTPEFKNQLEVRAREPRTKKRLPKEVMRQVLIDLCKDQFITRQCLAQLVKRDPDSLRQQYLTELVDEQKLTLAFPQSPTDSRQAYMANSIKPVTSDT